MYINYLEPDHKVWRINVPRDIPFFPYFFYVRRQRRRIRHIFVILRNLSTQDDMAVLIHLFGTAQNAKNYIPWSQKLTFQVME